MAGTWNHVQGGGAQSPLNTQRTLTATFASAVAAGDLIVVSVGWYATLSYVYPTVARLRQWRELQPGGDDGHDWHGQYRDFLVRRAARQGRVELHHHGNPAVVRQRVLHGDVDRPVRFRHGQDLGRHARQQQLDRRHHDGHADNRPGADRDRPDLCGGDQLLDVDSLHVDSGIRGPLRHQRQLRGRLRAGRRGSGELVGECQPFDRPEHQQSLVAEWCGVRRRTVGRRRSRGAPHPPWSASRSRPHSR